MSAPLARLALGALLAGAVAACGTRSSADAAAEVLAEEAAFRADSAAIADRVRLDTVTSLYRGPNPLHEEDARAPDSLWRHVARGDAFCDADARRAAVGDTLRCPWQSFRDAGLASAFDGGFRLHVDPPPPAHP